MKRKTLVSSLVASAGVVGLLFVIFGLSIGPAALAVSEIAGSKCRPIFPRWNPMPAKHTI